MARRQSVASWPLARRSYRRMCGREPLWNGNSETLSGLLGGRDSLFGYALRMHFRRRKEWPELFAGLPVIRLRTTAEVADFLRRGG